jgi:hypothetical protein
MRVRGRVGIFAGRLSFQRRSHDRLPSVAGRGTQLVSRNQKLETCNLKPRLSRHPAKVPVEPRERVRLHRAVEFVDAGV